MQWGESWINLIQNGIKCQHAWIDLYQKKQRASHTTLSQTFSCHMHILFIFIYVYINIHVNINWSFSVMKQNATCFKFKAVLDQWEDAVSWHSLVCDLSFSRAHCVLTCIVSNLTLSQSSVIFCPFLWKTKVIITNTLRVGTLTPIVTDMKMGLGLNLCI